MSAETRLVAADRELGNARLEVERAVDAPLRTRRRAVRRLKRALREARKAELDVTSRRLRVTWPGPEESTG